MLFQALAGETLSPVMLLYVVMSTVIARPTRSTRTVLLLARAAPRRFFSKR